MRGGLVLDYANILLFIVVVGGLFSLTIIIVSAIVSEGKLADEIRREEKERLRKSAELETKYIETE